MPRRWIQLLLLASIAFWATGSAAYLHELIEHTHAQPAPHSIQAGADFSKAAGHTHSEQECPVCASLAAMHLANVAPAVSLISTRRCVGSALVYEALTLAKSAISIPLSRGPPLKVCSFHSA